MFALSSLQHPIPLALLFLHLLYLVVGIPTASAENNTENQDLQIIQALLKKPDHEIDLARAKLTIDRMIDPTIDIEHNAKQIDAMAEQIKTMLPPNAADLQKMETLVQYIYVAGPWNNHRPFRYDLADPFGKNIHNKLLPTYLKKRLGNCISMPFLFISLAQRLGLEATATTAPNHLLVKYRLDDDIFRNFEATSGGPKLDESYQREMEITDKALVNGIYLRSLSKKESIVVMVSTLLEFYAQKNQQEERIALANLSLRYAPKDADSMLHLIAGTLKLVDQKYQSRYRSPWDIPPEERDHYQYLMQNMEKWRQTLEASGWRPYSATVDANYLAHINQTKAAQKKGKLNATP